MFSVTKVHLQKFEYLEFEKSPSDPKSKSTLQSPLEEEEYPLEL